MLPQLSIYHQIPSHWCSVPELSQANWTAEQIRNISAVGTGPSWCSKYDYDYSHLAKIGFEESVKYAEEHHESVGSVECTEYNYGDDVERKSMVEEVRERESEKHCRAADDHRTRVLATFVFNTGARDVEIGAH